MDQDPVKDCRELCMAAANEPDAKKLATLVTEIIKRLDGQNRGAAHRAPDHNLEGRSFVNQHVSGRRKIPCAKTVFHFAFQERILAWRHR